MSCNFVVEVGFSWVEESVCAIVVSMIAKGGAKRLHQHECVIMVVRAGVIIINKK